MADHEFEIELRGYNKDEVDTYLREMEGEYRQKLSRMDARNKELEKQVEELKRRVEKKERQKEALERDIETKYRTYIDNYDKIAALVYESQLKADQILAEAHEKEEVILAEATSQGQQIVDAAIAQRDEVLKEAEESLAAAKEREQQILTEADQEAERRVTAVNDIVDECVGNGRKRYDYVYGQLSDLAAIMAEAQRRFSNSYNEIQSVFDSMPGTLDECASEEGDLDEDDFDEDEDELNPEDL